MKGIILAGGLGTRLKPMTNYINKHLLPVGPFPMIYCPILKLKEAGIEDILMITNRGHLSSFIQLLGLGEELGVRIGYKVQENEGSGIADALYLAKDFVNHNRFIVILGDNIFEDPLLPYINAFMEQPYGARVLLKEVADPKLYGVASLNKKNNEIVRIEEKPCQPASSYCVTGIYMYDEMVFKFLEKMKPSARGELEITDVNNLYIKESQLKYDVLKGLWVDAGTHESLHEASSFIFRQLNRM